MSQDEQINPSYFMIPVSGLSTKCDQNFGLEKVCFHIKHRRPTDLKIELISPSGISVWLSNRNGNDNTYGYLNTCVVESGFNGSIHEGSNHFKGEFSAEGRLDFFNRESDPNGVWILVITDLDQGVLGKLESIDISFGDNPAHISKSPCNDEHPEDCLCSNNEGRLLPDLAISPNLTSENIIYTDDSNKTYPNRLRFAAAMMNIGEGPLQIITSENWYCGDSPSQRNTQCLDGSFPTSHVHQVIYRKETSGMRYDTVKAGQMFFDDSPGHNHFHVKDWASFKLLKKRWWSNNPECWKVVASSEKVSYCLFDNKTCNSSTNYCQENNVSYTEKNLPNYGLGDFMSCNSRKQGISVGGIDYYGMNYEGQSIQLPSDIKSGLYYLYIKVDPLNQYAETNEDNNVLLIPVKI